MVDGGAAVYPMGHWTGNRALPDCKTWIAALVLDYDVFVFRRLQHLLRPRLLRCFLSIEIFNSGSGDGVHSALPMAGACSSALHLLRHSS